MRDQSTSQIAENRKNSRDWSWRSWEVPRSKSVANRILKIG